MILFDFKILWPWSKGNNFVNYCCKSWRLSKNKTFEIQLCRDGINPLIEFRVNVSWRGRDHAGSRISLALLGLNLLTQVYDSRHWNYEENRWEIYPGEADEQ